MMPPGSSHIRLELLGRYLDGTASPEERTLVEAWIGADPARRAAVAALEAAWLREREQLAAPYDVDAAWTRFASRDAGRHAGRQRLASPRWLPAAMAAAVVAVVGAGAGWWLAHPTRAAAPAMREYATPRGRRAVFRLLDGSEIMLNAESRLRVPVAFRASQRDAQLDGEAFFSVVHDTARPFVVQMAHGVVRDVGTRFSVHAYADAAVERVAVVEGAVAVAEIPLHAGEVATLSGDSDVRVLRGASVTAEVAWTRGRLVFTSLPLGEAAQRLARWYDPDVRVTDSALARRPVTGSYSSEPLGEVLTLITAAVGARYEWRGRTVTIATGTGAR